MLKWEESIVDEAEARDREGGDEPHKFPMKANGVMYRFYIQTGSTILQQRTLQHGCTYQKE